MDTGDVTDTPLEVAFVGVIICLVLIVILLVLACYFAWGKRKYKNKYKNTYPHFLKGEFFLKESCCTMNSKEATEGKKPKYGKLQPNQLTVFQHPDAPFLKISINSTPTNAKDERATVRTSLRTPRPTTPTKAGGLCPPRDLSKSRSLSPARNRPPQLPTGQTGNTEKLAQTQKKSFVDHGAAKLYEKATELRSSLDVPTFRVPIVREKSPDSISLPSSPMNSRKIGLSYLTPPTGRKLGSCVSPSHLAKKNDKDMIAATVANAPVQQANKPFTFQLCAPDHPASNPTSRAASPGPFTSVLKSGSLSEESASKSFHSDFKERGGDRISRFDGYRSGLSPHDGYPSQGDTKMRGVSPTPLNNLKIAKECKESGRNSSDKGKKLSYKYHKQSSLGCAERLP